MMLVIVCYDVTTVHPKGRNRLRRVAKLCCNYGLRVQSSVFECLIEPDQWARLRASLLETYNGEEDSLRFYFLGKNWKGRKEHHGAKAVPDLDDPLII